MINKNWSFRRGDIYLADLGEHHGHIQGGTRPVVVIQNDYGNRFSSTLIVVPLTTEIKKQTCQRTTSCGINAVWTSHAWPWPEQIQTIRKSQIIRYLGHVRPIHMSCIDLSIRESISLPPQCIIHVIPPDEQKE